jgi:hypothetical protein
MNAPENPSVCTDKSKCRLSEGASMSTCMAYHPVYDGNGKQVGGFDPNRHTTPVSCSTCSQRWYRVAQHGKVEWQKNEHEPVPRAG